MADVHLRLDRRLGDRKGRPTLFLQAQCLAHCLTGNTWFCLCPRKEMELLHGLGMSSLFCRTSDEGLMNPGLNAMM